MYSNQKSNRSPLTITWEADSPACASQRRKARSFSRETAPKWVSLTMKTGFEDMSSCGRE